MSKLNEAAQKEFDILAANKNRNEVEELRFLELTALQETAKEVKAKAHPLGEKIKIKAHALSTVDKKSQIFLSINKYTVEFQQNKEVFVREKFVDFMESATKPFHTVNEEGKPVTESEPLYAVSRLK